MQVGEKGISVQLLAKHVYNRNLSLFFTPDMNEIRTYVQQYLLKNSKSPLSLIEATGKRGHADARQLMLEFSESDQ